MSVETKPGEGVESADVQHLRQCFDRLHGLRLTIEKQNLPLPRTIIVDAQQAAGTLLVEIEALRERAERAEREIEDRRRRHEHTEREACNLASMLSGARNRADRHAEQSELNMRRAVAAESKLAEVERERDEARAAFGAAQGVAVQEKQRAEAAEAQVAELRKDAERYRWLRVNPNNHCVTYEFRDGSGYGYLVEDELDAAIDAALASTAPKESA
jgi:chromosome segregation ATPase